MIIGKFVYAQEYDTHIHGYVFDKSSGEPIEDVNVYVANSTWGSSTNSDGYYSFFNIPPGAHELVVTNIGYKYETQQFILEPAGELKFNFHLKPIIYESETTIVEGDIPTDWLNDLEIFERYFLGNNQFADECEIENKEVLNFKRPYESMFEATALQPLVIINQALGYKLTCVLIKFEFNTASSSYRWSIKPQFINLDPKDENQTVEWIQNRQEAFEGSVYHFLRSFCNQILPEEGFDITNVEWPGQKLPREEWRPILVDYRKYMDKGVFPNETILHFDNYLHVIFDNSLVSWIGLNHANITLDEYGNPYEGNPYVVYGEWANHGIADLLPKNYTPSQ